MKVILFSVEVQYSKQVRISPLNHLKLNCEDCYCIQPEDRCYIFYFVSFSVGNLSTSRKNVAKCSEISSYFIHAVISTERM